MQCSSSFAASLPSCIGTVPSANEAVLVACDDEFGDTFVDHARGRHRIFERDRVIALRRRRHHQLHVDAHVVHNGKALVIAASCSRGYPPPAWR